MCDRRRTRRSPDRTPPRPHRPCTGHHRAERRSGRPSQAYWTVTAAILVRRHSDWYRTRAAFAPRPTSRNRWPCAKRSWTTTALGHPTTWNREANHRGRTCWKTHIICFFSLVNLKKNAQPVHEPGGSQPRMCHAVFVAKMIFVFLKFDFDLMPG